MSDISSTKDERLPPAPPALRWQSWPAREKPLCTVMLAVGLFGVAVGICLLTVLQALPVILAAIVLILSAWRFFLPVVFELNEDGVDQWIFGRPRRVPWQAVRRYMICSAGVLLLPHEDPSPLAALRGLYVPFCTHRDEILARVDRYLDRAERP